MFFYVWLFFHFNVMFMKLILGFAHGSCYLFLLLKWILHHIHAIQNGCGNRGCKVQVTFPNRIVKNIHQLLKKLYWFSIALTNYHTHLAISTTTYVAPHSFEGQTFGISFASFSFLSHLRPQLRCYLL